MMQVRSSVGIGRGRMVVIHDLKGCLCDQEFYALIFIRFS